MTQFQNFRRPETPRIVETIADLFVPATIALAGLLTMLQFAAA